MDILKTTCKPLDLLIGGGLESSIITKIYGEAGTGKTNICLQVARECVKSGKKVAYIDSEGVSLKRLEQICQKEDYNKILKSILFFSPSSFSEQEEMINKSIKIENIGLIIVDTINLLYRVCIEKNKDEAIRSFIRQMSNLQIAARKNNLFVVVTEQVYSDKEGVIQPFTNREADHIAKTILKLEKKEIGVRQVTIIKHRFRPEGIIALFRIVEIGLE